MADNSNSKFSSYNAEKEKLLLKGTRTAFPLEAHVDSTPTTGKRNVGNGRIKSGIASSRYQEELKKLSLNTKSVAIGGNMKIERKDEGVLGSNVYINDGEDTGSESDKDIVGGSEFLENSNEGNTADRVHRIYESLSSFNERFRNFDALTSSRLSVVEEQKTPANSSRISTKPPSRSPVSTEHSGRKVVGSVARIDVAVTTVRRKPKKDEKNKASVRRERDPRRDLTHVVPKMFGLDPMAVVDDSSGDEDEDTSLSQFQSQSEPLSGSTDRRQRSKKVERRHLKTTAHHNRSINDNADSQLLASDEDSPNLGPVMPSLSDKKFLHKLQQREGRMTKEINDMKNHLDVINTNVEKALRKAQVDADRRKGQNFKVQTKKQTTKAPGTVRKLLGKMPNTNEGPSKKLTEFLQATGGLTGGWTHDDHSVFMRTYLKWKDRPVKMLDIVTKLLPNKNSQDVMAHVSWYDQYDSLHKTNQAYIRQWRINKRHEQEMIYRMASEGQKATLEANKRRQELLQAARQQEREKNQSRLIVWKKSSKQKTTSASDDERKHYVDEFIKKNSSMNIMNVRKRLEALTEPRVSDRDSIPGQDSPRTNNLKAFNKTIRDRSAPSRSISTASSSGVFTDTNESTSKRVTKGRVAYMRIGPGNPDDGNEFDEYHHLPKIHSSKTGGGKKLLMQFKSRDNKMLQARKEAIDNVRSRLKKTLTDEDVKKRIGVRKVESPSTVMQETKGWSIRNEIRKTEREEAENEKFQKALPSAKRRMQPVPFVNHIPKLATPTWRNI